jgi:hypothetical protein
MASRFPGVRILPAWWCSATTRQTSNSHKPLQNWRPCSGCCQKRGRPQRRHSCRRLGGLDGPLGGLEARARLLERCGALQKASVALRGTGLLSGGNWRKRPMAPHDSRVKPPHMDPSFLQQDARGWRGRAEGMRKASSKTRRPA